jgi:hypothetical protein
MMTTARAMEPTKSPAGPGSRIIGVKLSAVVAVDANSGMVSRPTLSATARAAGCARPQASGDLVGHHDARVHQQAKGHDHSRYAHLVDRQADGVHRRKAGKADDRQDDGHDQRRAQTQRDEENCDHQTHAQRHVAPNLGQSFIGIGGLVEDQLCRHPRRQAGLEPLECRTDVSGPDVDLQSVLQLGSHQHCRNAVLQRGLGRGHARAALMSAISPSRSVVPSGPSLSTMTSSRASVSISPVTSITSSFVAPVTSPARSLASAAWTACATADGTQAQRHRAVRSSVTVISSSGSP